VNKFLVDLADRVGSTAVQSFAGSLTALTATGTLGALADWKAAAITAGAAALLSLAKALGVAASQSTPAVVQSGGSVTIDEEALVKALGQKLSGK
jgi:hypothetical protein